MFVRYGNGQALLGKRAEPGIPGTSQTWRWSDANHVAEGRHETSELQSAQLKMLGKSAAVEGQELMGIM